MSVMKRIYILFDDGSVECKAIVKLIEKYTPKVLITIISVENSKRSSQVLNLLREESIYPQTTSEGLMKAIFLVREQSSALYPLSDASTVIMLANRR